METMSYSFHKHISVHYLAITLLIIMVWKTFQNLLGHLFYFINIPNTPFGCPKPLHMLCTWLEAFRNITFYHAT